MRNYNDKAPMEKWTRVKRTQMVKTMAIDKT